MQKFTVPTRCAIHDRPASGAIVNNVGWCEECEHRRELWTWGVQHSFPEVRIGIYAMGKGRGTWLFQVSFATDERIAELLCFVMAYDAESPARQQEIQDEVAQDIAQREAAVRRWIAQARAEMEHNEDVKHR